MMTAITTQERATPASVATSGARKDIQALRALAVASVVVYHLWPAALPGGFVGVDVFFVVSGFLITTHLIRRPPARASDFAAFWARRMLRLLPPVVIVILATLLGTVLLLSAGQWERMAREAITSMLYVQNWQLISDATDYLDARRAVSPFQHFWSLSIEEQYYVVWPLLVGVIAWLTRRASAVERGRAYLLGFGLVVGGSFVLGVMTTASSPSVAYFSTLTRMWELGLGSLLAAAYPWLAPRLTPSARAAALWVGLGAIALALAAIDGETPFPGTAAVLPTLGAVLVLVAADPEHASNPRRLSYSRPVQLLGDTSYALYLWHWPLIVFAPYALDREASSAEKVLLLALSILLAWLSTTLVENPVRSAAYLSRHTGPSLVLGVALSFVVLASALGLDRVVDGRVDGNRARVEAALASPDQCFGAAALDPARRCSGKQPLVTSPEFTKADITEGILGCLNWVPFPDPLVSCRVGDTTRPVKRIALFGNSHAGHWTEALEVLGKEHQWAVDTFIIGVCKSTVEAHVVDTSIGASTEGCQRKQTDVVQEIVDGGYDAVVVSSMDRDPTSTPGLYASTLEALSTASNVLVIRDTPAPMDQDNEPPDCVARSGDDVSACAGTSEEWIGADPLAEQAAMMASERISLVGVNQYLCQGTTCPAVIGGVIVYSDFNHLSKTFSRTLAPYLEPALLATVG